MRKSSLSGSTLARFPDSSKLGYAHPPYPYRPRGKAEYASAEWGRHYGEHLVRALGFTHRSPCAATLHTVLRRLDRETFEAKLGAWPEGS